MRVLRGLVLCAALAPLAARADVAECTAVLDRLTALVGLPAGAATFGAVTEVEGTCVARQIMVTLPGSRVRADLIRWQGQGLVALAADLTPPPVLSVAVEGIRIIPQTGDSLMDYLLAVQADQPGGFDARLVWRFLPETRTLAVEELTITQGPEWGGVALSGRIEPVDISSSGALLTSLGGTGVTLLTGSIWTSGLFEGWFAMPLGTALLSGSTDPAAEVERLKAEGIALAATLPDSIFPAPTRAALADLIDTLPHPPGTLRFTLTASPGLGAPRLTGFALRGIPDTPEELWPALEGVTLGLTWEPSLP